MINGKRVAVVMPAYNAEETLESTVLEIPDLVDIRILVDDNSSDDTVKLAERLGLQVFVHNKNYGYGRNAADLLSRSFGCGCGSRYHGSSRLSIHALLITAMASMVAYGVYDMVL